MALVLLCGQPCSGKSTAAAVLSKALATTFHVSLIDEPSLNLQRNESFRDMPSEKILRGLLRSAVDRSVSKDTVVIVDSLNNIKGYRYELWCLARAAGIRYCVSDCSKGRRQLHCDVSEEECRAWNNARKQEGIPCYEDSIFNDLVRRFERPDGRNRWDSPLFELKPAVENIQEGSKTLVELVGFLSGQHDSAFRNSRVLQPTIATQNPCASDPNSLYELDRATQAVMFALVVAQGQGFAGVQNVAVGDDIPNVILKRSVGLPELRRHRRTFIKLAGQSSLSGPPPPSDAQSVKRMFANYLNQEL